MAAKKRTAKKATKKTVTKAAKKVAKKTVKKAAKKGARKPAKKAARGASKKAAAKKAGPKAPKLRSVTPYLAVNDAKAALKWYKKALGAQLTEIQHFPDGKVMHAALNFGDYQFFLSDLMDGADMVDAARTGATVNVHLWTPDADKVWKKAVKNGAKVTMPISDMFWGDRYGRFIDPFGHSWALGCKSKLTKPQLKKLEEEMMAQMAGK